MPRLLAAGMGLLLAVLTLVPLTVLLVGCGDPSKPEAVWCTTGVGPAQVVYPRGICYSPKDDSYFIVDVH